MSTTICRGCGQPLDASHDVCTNCGIRQVLPGNATAAPVALAGAVTVTEPVTTSSEVTAPAGAVASDGAAATTPMGAAAAAEPQSTAPMYPYQSAQTTKPDDARRRLILTAVTALVLTLIARLGFAVITGHAKPEGEVIAQLPVGANGGSANFANGGKITVPKGAVKKPEKIVVRQTVIRDRIRAVSPFGGPAILIPPGTQVVYIFGPTNLVFLTPVTIVLPAPPPPARGLVFISANGRITFIQGTPGAGTITLRVLGLDFNRPGTIVL